MGAIDYRYPYAVILRYRGHPHEARIIPLDFEDFAKPYLLASCINSVELLLSWRIREGRILWFLGKAMNAPWLSDRNYFDCIPDWLKLSALPVKVLAKFKLELINEIEHRLILDIDPDPEQII